MGECRNDDIQAGAMTPREPRRKVMIKARMRLDGAWHDVCIRDISSRGLLLHAAAVPARGTYVEVRRGPHTIVARVVWAQERKFGVRTQDRLNVDAVVNEPDLTDLDFRKASAAQPAFERRKSARKPDAAELSRRAERNRTFARAMEFAVVGASGAAAALLVFGIVLTVLTQSLGVVSAQLVIQ